MPAEAESIKIDDLFYDDLTIASDLSGKDKSNAHIAAMKALLSRNNIDMIKSDFWKVFRILKGKAENS